MTAIKNLRVPRIQNVSLDNIVHGRHMAVDHHSMLIQIVDPDMDFPVPKYSFGSVHQFKFLDIEQSGMTMNGDGTWVDVSEFAITQEQADTIVKLLQGALRHGIDVVVHCVAGICRSGAVCEVGVMMGFEDTGAFRNPNLLVKHNMMRSLGWTYDCDDESSHNGITTESGIIIPGV